MSKVELNYVKSDDMEVHGGPDEVPELELYMDEDGDATLYVCARHNSFNGVSEREHHRVMLAWGTSLPAGRRVIEDVEAISELATALPPLLQRVHDGHEVGWDEAAGNVIGTLTEDACKASDEIEALLSSTKWTLDVEVMAAQEWVYLDQNSSLGIVCGCEIDQNLVLDESLWDGLAKNMAEIYANDAEGMGIHLDGNIKEVCFAVLADAKKQVLEELEFEDD